MFNLPERGIFFEAQALNDSFQMNETMTFPQNRSAGGTEQINVPGMVLETLRSNNSASNISVSF